MPWPYFPSDDISSGEATSSSELLPGSFEDFLRGDFLDLPPLEGFQPGLALLDPETIDPLLIRGIKAREQLVSQLRPLVGR